MQRTSEDSSVRDVNYWTNYTGDLFLVIKTFFEYHRFSRRLLRFKLEKDCEAGEKAGPWRLLLVVAKRRLVGVC